MAYTIIKEDYLLDFLNSNNIEGDERLFIIENTRKQNLIFDALNKNLDRNFNALFTFDKNLYARFKDYSFKSKVEFFLDDNNELNFSINGVKLYSNIKEVSHEQALSFINNNTLSRITIPHMSDMFSQLIFRYINESVALLNKDKDIESPTFIKDYKDIPMLFAFGLGSAFYLNTLYSSLNIKRALIFEPNEDLFYIALHLFDFSSFFTYIKEHNLDITFCIGGNKNDIISYLKSYLNLHGNFIADLSAIYIHMQTPILNEVIAYLQSNYVALNMGIGFFDDSLFALSHSIYNIEHKKNFILKDKELNDAIKDVNIFIVANGPSLDKDIDFLRKNQDKALIIACGTALDSLYNSGIEADFYVVTERCPNIFESIAHLNNNNFLDKVIMVGSDIVHNSTFNLFKKHMLFLKDGEIFANLIHAFNFEYEDKIRPIAHMNPLVSNLALSFVLNLGFKHIYLFGVDNGKKDYINLHSTCSSYYNARDDLEDYSYYMLNTKVPGNFGGFCESNSLYKHSILELENAILESNRNDFSIVNCSDGARILHTHALRSDALDFSLDSDLNKELIKDSILSTITKSIDFDTKLFLEHINKDDYKDYVQTLIHALSFKVSSRNEYIEKLEHIYKDINNTNIFNRTMLKASLSSFITLIINALYKYGDDRDFTLANKVKDLFSYFLLDSIELVYLLPNYLMGEHRALINYKIGHDHGDSLSISTDLCSFELDKAILAKMQNIAPFTKRYN